MYEIPIYIWGIPISTMENGTYYTLILGTGSPYLQWRMVTIHLAMYSYEISFDQHTYDGVPISTMSRFVNEISFDQHIIMMESPYLLWSIWYLDEISFDQSTFGDGVPIHLQWRMVPISMYEISFDQHSTMGSNGE